MAHSSSSSSSSPSSLSVSASASAPSHPLLGDGEPSFVASPSSSSPPRSAMPMGAPRSRSEHSASTLHPHSTTTATTTTTMTTTTATTTTQFPFPVPPPPAPIPLPEPVHVPPQSTTDTDTDPDHAQAATRTSSSQDSPPRPSADLYGSIDLTSSSPKEINQLLAAHTNNNNSDVAPLTMAPRRPRPHNAPSSSANPSVGSRYSAADAYAPRPQSSYSFSGPPPQDSRPASVARQRSSQFVPSPLNPNAPRTRPNSTHSRPASMVLYRLAGLGDEELRFQQQAISAALTPPPPIATTGSSRSHRVSVYSSNGSIFSEVGDSKYPARQGDDSPSTPPPSGRFLPYEYDPTDDLEKPDDAEDELHTPDPVGTREKISAFNTRGFANIFVIVLLLLGLITLFLGYPILSERTLRFQSSLYFDINNGDDNDGTTNTQQQSSLPANLIDGDTPQNARSRVGFDGKTYQLVFSDEFNKDGRGFKAGDDPYWEAVNLFDSKSADLQWYEPGQVTTKNGHLVITLANEASNGMQYKSGMLQSWNKFCFSSGYIEVSVQLPGSSSSFGLTPQVYTLGNLARAGYGATEDGVFPYSYNSCDVGIFPNQTNSDGSTPAAATTNGDPKADGALSYLRGQKLSTCPCRGEDHPNPTSSMRGRGAPQIDILNVQTTAKTEGTISQTLRFAPMNAAYTYAANGTQVVNTAVANANNYQGRVIEEAVSALIKVPAGAYASDGSDHATFGYEHFADPSSASDGFISWSMGGSEVFKMTAAALVADPKTLVSNRLVPEEPMSIVLSLAMSQALATVDPTGLTFPAEFKIDYVRVYQRQGAQNIGCDPSDHPTKDYISRHDAAYSDATKKTWADAGYVWPKNTAWDGCTA